MRIACKFGGTSLADSEKIRGVIRIIERDPNRKLIVVSAPGKRTSDDRKITDLFYLAHETAKNNLDHQAILKLIRERFEEIRNNLQLDLDLDEPFSTIAEKIGFEKADYAASRGEYLNGLLIAKAMQADFVDPFDHIFFDKEGYLDSKKTYVSLGKALNHDRRAVIPGFYGQDTEGKVKTFSRGGSDITGAIVARAAGVRLYENWTDVSGLLMADPSIVKNAKPIEEVTYMELRELSYMGAQVLHEEAVFPVRETGIPIVIKNSLRPEDRGTTIAASRESQNLPVVGVAGKKNFEAVFVQKALMNKEIGFARKLLGIFESFGISVEHIPSGIDSMSVIVSKSSLESHREKLLDIIQTQLCPDVLSIDGDLALIAVVGSGMAHHCGTAAKLFSALANAGVNIRLIDQGASELTIIIGVTNDDFSLAIQTIYKTFS
ncbi:MAG: aspartate kinase [Planctomycetes bacterium]|nr:aspartate kinase [Planctomycetota bacterium]